MDWEDFMEFLLEGKKKEKKKEKLKKEKLKLKKLKPQVNVVKTHSPSGGLIAHINPGIQSEPNSALRRAEVRALMKMNGGGAIKRALKRREIGPAWRQSGTP